MKRYIRFFIAVAFISSQIFAPHVLAFQEEEFLSKIRESEEPVVVKGKKVEYFHDQKKVVGSGDVSISYGEIELRCDKITVYTDTKEAICEGNVRISQPGASMEGDRIHYNFSTRRGYALESDVKVPPFYGTAKRVEQTGDKEIVLEKGYITTCDLEKPHYRIQAKEVKIFFEDKIVAKHIFFFVGNVPVLYLPIYVQPFLDNKPEATLVVGRTSDWGYYGLTSWRYYFNDDSKGYVHLDYRDKKGLAGGIDYKRNFKEMGKGIARFYYAYENDLLTVTEDPPTDDRWRVQYRHSLDLPEDTVATLEFNKLSDRNMIKDYLYREYEENPVPDNYILFKTTKPNYILSFLARKRIDDFFTVVERLPEFKLEVYNQRLWNTSFFYTTEDSITNFIKRYDKEEDEDISPEKSIRADTFHRLSYAAKLFKFLYVTPFMGTRQTFYSQNRWKEPTQFRSIYETGVDTSAKFYRVFDVNSNVLNLDLNRLRHIITPTVGFLHRHQPTISPENLYEFDEIDEIEQYNGFKLALENKLQTKRPHGEGMKTVDLATFIVSSDYIFKLKKRSLDSKGIGRFGDFRFDLELRPYTWLSIDSDMTVDHKDYDINSANIDFFVDMGKKFTLGIGHRYESTEDEKTSQFTGEIFYNINDDWKVRIYQRFNFADFKWEEQEYVIYKDLHCWLAELSLEVREGEFATWLVFRLKAFPDIPIGLYKTTYRKPHPGGRR